MQAFGAESGSKAHFAEAVESTYRAARAATVTRSLLIAVAVSLAFCSVVFVLWLGARDVLAGRMSAGLLSQFVLFAVLAATSLGELSQVWSEAAATAGSAGRIAELLAVRPDIVAPPSPVAMPTPPRGAIAFEHVGFGYKGRRTRECSTTSASRSRPANGSHRRRLGLRQVDPVPAHHALLRLRRRPGARRRRRCEGGRSQGPSRADRAGAPGTLGLRRDGRGEYRLWSRRRERARDRGGGAARGGGRLRARTRRGLRHGPRRARRHPVGWREAEAGDRAGHLKDAAVLLLDEATSALDAENEALVQAALDDVMNGRTTLVIAHRFATVLKADRILVMDAGRIVEEGDHASLVARGGVYARLARLQFHVGAAALMRGGATI